MPPHRPIGDGVACRRPWLGRLTGARWGDVGPVWWPGHCADSWAAAEGFAATKSSGLCHHLPAIEQQVKIPKLIRMPIFAVLSSLSVPPFG